MNLRWHTWAHFASTLLLIPGLGGCGLFHTVDIGVDAGGDGSVDIGTVDAASDTPPEIDAGPAPSCFPVDAASMQCPDLHCDALPSFAWDGERCIAIECGECVGEECGQLTSQAVCESAHSGCEAPLCRNTGGEWRFWAEDCTHYVCGQSPPVLCAVGQAVCDCGPTSSFEAGMGCVPDPSCDHGLVPDDQALCEVSGGQWSMVCSHTHCGDAPDPCTNLACRCGDREVFNPVRGCTTASVCLERATEEVCDDSRDRCPHGEICCAQFSGAGPSAPVCRRPLCDPGPTEDICGNCTDCP